MCCGAVLLLRRSARSGLATPAAPRNLMIWMGLCGSAVMTVIAFVSPFWQPGRRAVPLEWQLMIGWALLGTGVYWRLRKALPHQPQARSV